MRGAWLWLLLLIAGAEAIQVTTVVAQMREARQRMRERQAKVLGGADLANLSRDAVAHVLQHGSFKKGLHAFATRVLRDPSKYGLNLEVEEDEGDDAVAPVALNPQQVKELYDAVDQDRAGLTKAEWMALGGDGEKFDDMATRTSESAAVPGVLPMEKVRQHSNDVGKVGSTTSLLEYPYLVQKLCSNGVWLRMCVAVGPYTVVHGLTMLVTLFMGGVMVMSCQHMRAKVADPSVHTWFTRYDGNSGDVADDIKKVDTLLSWKPYIGLILLGVGWLVVEVMHIVEIIRQPAFRVTEHRRAWFNHLKKLRHEGADISASVLGESENEVKTKQLQELAEIAGVANLAASRRDREEAEALNVQPNDIKSSGVRFAGYIVGGMLWALVMTVMIGLFKNGVFSQATYAGQQWLVAIPAVLFVLFTVVGFACDGKRTKLPFCNAFSRDVKAAAFGILALVAMVMPLVRDVQRTKEPLKVDPVNGLELTKQFDFDPRLTSDVQGRTIALLFGWLLVLLVGVFWSGNGKGNNTVAHFASDSARLFTNCLALVQDVYMFWHDYSRYSNNRAYGESMFDHQLPAWASSYITDLVTFVGDVMAIYPILYDYLTWKCASRADVLKHVDVMVVVMIAVATLFKVHAVNGQLDDDKATGQQFNQAAFAFSCFVLVVQLMVHMVRDGVSMTTALYGMFLFSVSVFLYLLLAMNMGAERPIVDGHLVSDLYMMKGMTGGFVFLQNMIKMAEPRWVYPNGSTTKGLLLFNFLASMLGRGWARDRGNVKLGEAISHARLTSEDLRDKPHADFTLKSWLERAHASRHDMGAVDEALRAKSKNSAEEQRARALTELNDALEKDDS